MTLLFDSNILPPDGANELFGFVQTSHLPSEFIVTKGERWPKCPNCGSCFFLLDDESSFDCPICHPENTYSKRTFKVIDKKCQMKPRNYILLDIFMSLDAISSILKQFVDNLSDTDEIWLIFISKVPIFCFISNSVLCFDFPLQSQDKTFCDPRISLRYRMTKKQLSEIVIPSVSSVFALRQLDEETKCDLWLALEQTFQNRGHEPAIVFAFVASSVANVPVSDEFTETLEKNRDVVCHIGLNSDGFVRGTMASRGSVGCVFRLNYVSKNVVRKLIDASVRVKRVLTLPECLALREIRGALTSRVKTGNGISKIHIHGLAGGVGVLSFDPTKTDFSVIRIVEKIVTDSAEFISLHTFQNANGFSEVLDRSVMNTIQLKLAADAALRDIWRRKRFDAVISAFKTDVTATNSLKNLGTDQEADVAALWYVLASIGPLDLEEKVYRFDGKLVLVSPPEMYIVSDSEHFDGYGPWDVKKWPFDISVLSDQDKFTSIVQAKHLELPF